MSERSEIELRGVAGEGVGIKGSVLVLCGWVALIVASGVLDRPVAEWVRGTGLEEVVRWHWVARIVKAPGTYYFTLGVAVAFWLFHRLRWQAGGFVCLSGLAALSNTVGKWVFGRARPFRLVGGMEEPGVFEPHWFIYGWRGLFEQKDLAFPSGHSCTAFAAATAAAILLPKWRWAFYACAALVAVERVAENAHYVSDVVAGAALGVLGMRLTGEAVTAVIRRREARKSVERVKVGMGQSNHE